MRKMERKGAGAIIHAIVSLDADCSVEAGEYGVMFTATSQPVELNDFEMAAEAIRENVEDFGLKSETTATVMLREDGEWEDVHWHKYYTIEAFSLQEY